MPGRLRLIAKKYDGTKNRIARRPPTAGDVKELILKMARENRSWGYTRIQGAVANLRHEVGRATIAKILQEAGIDPAPGRPKGMTWKEFLGTHWDVLASTDFFKAEVWTLRQPGGCWLSVENRHTVPQDFPAAEIATCVYVFVAPPSMWLRCKCQR